MPYYLTTTTTKKKLKLANISPSSVDVASQVCNSGLLLAPLHFSSETTESDWSSSQTLYERLEDYLPHLCYYISIFTLFIIFSFSTHFKLSMFRHSSSQPSSPPQPPPSLEYTKNLVINNICYLPTRIVPCALYYWENKLK